MRRYVKAIKLTQKQCMGHREVGGFTCTYIRGRLLGLAVQRPWLALGGPILTLVA